MGIRDKFSLKNSTFVDNFNAYRRTGGIKILFSPVAFIAHTIGWIWGNLDSGEEISKSKPGLKSPSSYIIMGNIDDVWDDSK